MGWVIAGVVVFVLLLQIGVVRRAIVCLAKKLVAGSRFPTWMRRPNEWATGLLFCLVGILVAPAGWTPGWDKAIYLGIGVLVLIVAGLMAYARQLEIQSLESKYAKQLSGFLQNDLITVLTMYARALFEVNPQKRYMKAYTARDRTVQMAANTVGKTATQGTRACLYYFNDTRTELRPGDFAGREMCTKVFEPGHRTFDAINRGDFVFEPRLDDDEYQAENRRYRTFIAYPVSRGLGPRHPTYGALMVDCPNEGDLDKETDVAKVAVYSGLIAATYIAVDQPIPGNSKP
jgi:hypothetical protein